MNAALTREGAIALIAAKGAALRVPAMTDSDVRKIVEIPMRSGARHVEVYVGLPWSLVEGTGPGVSVFQLHEGRAGWSLVGGSSCIAASSSPNDLDEAIRRLEAEQAIFRPKPVAHAPLSPRQPRAAKPMEEANGAGLFVETRVVGSPRRATEADVDEAERSLGTRLPAGYRTFVVRLGDGVYGTKLRVYAPARVVSGLPAWRERIEQYWFWGDSPLAQETALQCICIADTLDGDELIVHPADPDVIHLLPRHSGRARSLGRGLSAAIGKIVRAKTPALEAFGSPRVPDE